MRKAAQVILTAGGVLMVLGAPVVASTGLMLAAGCMVAGGLVAFNVASRVPA
jgi:hypothetical protein